MGTPGYRKAHCEHSHPACIACLERREAVRISKSKSTARGKPPSDVPRESGNTPAASFSTHLAWQEAARWAEYLAVGTRDALSAWRDVRIQLAQARSRGAA